MHFERHVLLSVDHFLAPGEKYSTPCRWGVPVVGQIQLRIVVVLFVNGVHLFELKDL